MTASRRACDAEAAGWLDVPSVSRRSSSRVPGERELITFTVAIPSLENGTITSRRSPRPAAASIAKATTTIRYRDLETRYLYRDAVAASVAST